MLPTGFIPASQLTEQQLQLVEQTAERHRQQAAAAAAAVEGFVPASAPSSLSAPLPVHLHQSVPVAEGSQLKRRRVYGMTAQLSSGGSSGGGSASGGGDRGAAEPTAAVTTQPASVVDPPTQPTHQQTSAEAHEQHDADSNACVGDKRKTHAVDESAARDELNESKEAEATAESVSSAECIDMEADVDEMILPEVEAEAEAEADKECSSCGSDLDAPTHVDPLDSDMCTGGGEDVEQLADLAVEEENALAAEAEFEHSATNFECEVSGNVGFNLGILEADRIIEQLRQQKEQREREQRLKKQQDDEEKKEKEKPLLAIKKKAA